jgi:hypothetical protein
MATEETALRGRELFTRHEVLASGAATGVAGAVAMMAILMLGAMIEGLSIAHPARVIGESLIGPDALEGAAKIAYGVFVHVGVSVVMGVVFAALVPRDFPRASAIGMGTGFALLVFMFILMPLIVPWANPGLRDGVQGIGGTWIVGLAVFGAVLGTGPSLRRWLAAEERPVAGPGLAAQTEPYPPSAARARSRTETSR